MTLYHFDVSQDGGPWSDDDSGTDLPNDDDARDEAIDLAHCLARAPAWKIAVRVRNSKPEPLVIVVVSTEVQNRAAP